MLVAAEQVRLFCTLGSHTRNPESHRSSDLLSQTGILKIAVLNTPEFLVLLITFCLVEEQHSGHSGLWVNSVGQICLPQFIPVTILLNKLSGRGGVPRLLSLPVCTTPHFHFIYLHMLKNHHQKYTNGAAAGQFSSSTVETVFTD